MNIKYKIKFIVSNHDKLPLRVPGKYSYHMTGTVQLILGHCTFLSLCVNWPCVIDIFSFVRFLWIFSLLSVLAHLLKAMFQETSLFSIARRMPSHSSFFVVHVEEPRLLPIPAEVIWRCAWNIWIIFQTPHGFPIDSSCIQHIR